MLALEDVLALAPPARAVSRVGVTRGSVDGIALQELIPELQF